MRQGKLNGSHIWGHNTAAGRWYALGRYYAMFPRDFIHDAIDGLTDENDVVLDPFCGRGNAPFVATILQRQALAIDNNPIAWLFAAAKQHPAADPEQVTERLCEVARSRRRADRRSRNRFETMAWAPDVRALLKAARRELQWHDSVIDRTLMAFITLHMQDKLGAGLSNSLSPTIAYSPDYAVKWWTDKGLLKPPEIEPVAILEDKIQRRYKYGVPQQAHSRVLMGDSRDELPRLDSAEAKLLITSPPYRGVTDYWNDHWTPTLDARSLLRQRMEQGRKVHRPRHLQRLDLLRPQGKQDSPDRRRGDPDPERPTPQHRRTVHRSDENGLGPLESCSCDPPVPSTPELPTVTVAGARKREKSIC